MAKESLKERLLKNTTLKFTSSLDESKLFSEKDMISTSVPMINVALGGMVEGGFTPGITMIAAPSKHFKSGFCLLLARAFLDKYEDGMILFYDSEFGTPLSYWDTFDIDKSKVIHSPITDVEEFKIDIVAQLKDLDRKDHVMIIADSIGNLASLKEVEDAEKGKTVADMSRAKAIKGLFRIIGAKLTLKDIPFIVINHVYDSMDLFPKKIVSGGTGSYYNADNIWIVGRQQTKDGEELSGYKFIINIEKSRYVKEKSKIPITISFDGGINRWSGLFEIALQGKFIVKGDKKGTYLSVDLETGEIKDNPRKEDDMANDTTFWKYMLKQKTFTDYIEKEYKMSTGNSILGSDDE